MLLHHYWTPSELQFQIQCRGRAFSLCCSLLLVGKRGGRKHSSRSVARQLGARSVQRIGHITPWTQEETETRFPLAIHTKNTKCTIWQRIRINSLILQDGRKRAKRQANSVCVLSSEFKMPE